jgi:hypothetical protein
VVLLTDERVRTADRAVRWAERLLDRAIEDATAIGLAGKVDQWTAARDALRATAADVEPIAIRREAGRWLVVSRTHRVLVGNLVGMHYLARLLASPRVPISAVDLANRGDHAAVRTNQTVLDEQARAAYRTRARQLAAELAEARENADQARVERLDLELDALTTELDHAVGLGGRARHFPGPAERARTAVRKAIKRAIDAVHATAPDLAALLNAGISTGYHCYYNPTAPVTRESGLALSVTSKKMPTPPRSTSPRRARPTS